jgi:hypothetical protein
MRFVDKGESFLITGVEIGLIVTLCAGALEVALAIVGLVMFLFTGGSFAALSLEAITSVACFPIVSKIFSIAFTATAVLTALLVGLVFMKWTYSILMNNSVNWDNWNFLKIS